MFSLHPQLQKDCFVLGNFPLCKLLMMNDYHFPWFILVPKQENISEIFQLSESDQTRLIKESATFAELVKGEFKADKMNVAALGNQVPQLHIHVIARFSFDTAWPYPVWGRAQPLAYEKNQLLERVDRLKAVFKNCTSSSFIWDEQWV